MTIPRAAASRGFTLIELALALVVVVLILGSILVPLNTQVEQRKITDAQKYLDQVNEALTGFALSQTPPRLPCPDTTGDGMEDACPAAANTTTGGNVPWVTLGIQGTDPWGQRYQYRVNGAFAAAGGFTLTTVSAINGNGVIRVCADSGCATLVANTLPAAIYSAGPNGAIQPPASPDELENTMVIASPQYDRTFVSRTFSTTPGAEFDDVVTWLSAPILFNRMVAAGRLP